ncbi:MULTISPECIES: hypothetical protein [Streptomyces]|uniref:hypothetical protein n=1 Tax=Streptomyces TaxID=1883 RepID=UPI001675BEE3|nr:MULTISPECIES: hypothetical protein [Streptomyces]MBD3575394.1 hypothetical protein [Streptomyces sp. KD18]GGS92910.1 hypothetical protein GCM10010286_17140 [Streptomyces toxytricini]
MHHNTSPTDWYARALHNPAEAHAAWRTCGVAVLPLGECFEAIRFPQALAAAAVGCTTATVVNLAFADALEGPIIHDPRGGNYYLLVAPGTRTRWNRTHQRHAECLGTDTHLGVPHPAHHHPTRTRPLYWANPPTPHAPFCRTAAANLLLRIATARLTESAAVTP